MKKLLVLICTCVALSASAQDFRPFKVNLSLGYARPTGKGVGAGILMSLEPKYGLNDNIDVGLRAELGIMARALTINGQDVDGEVNATGSYVLTGTYLLSANNFRPYVGIGAGVYTVAGTSFSYTNNTQPSSMRDVTVEASRKFGALARAGFKAGHFNMGLEYNIVPSTKINLTTGQVAQSNNSYIGVKLGIDIGGGRH